MERPLSHPILLKNSEIELPRKSRVRAHGLLNCDRGENSVYQQYRTDSGHSRSDSRRRALRLLRRSLFPWRPPALDPARSPDRRAVASTEAAESNAQKTINCGKAETGVSLPHEQCYASRTPSTVGSRSGAPREGGSDVKNFCPLFPRNPLISLDSDERIQGNPSESNG